MLLYNIQLQPFVLRLEDELPEVSFPDFEKRVEAYINDVVVVGEDKTDLLIIDSICKQFELVSWALSTGSTMQPFWGSAGGPAGRDSHSAGSAPLLN
jgi:hypothetical protein